MQYGSNSRISYKDQSARLASYLFVEYAEILGHPGITDSVTTRLRADD